MANRIDAQFPATTRATSADWLAVYRGGLLLEYGWCEMFGNELRFEAFLVPGGANPHGPRPAGIKVF
jgi:hypothetical protein